MNDFDGPFYRLLGAFKAMRKWVKEHINMYILIISSGI